MTSQISSESHLYIIIIFLFVKYGYLGLMTERKALWMSKTMCYITLNCDFFCKICSNTVCILNLLMYTRYPLIYIPNATMWLQIYISLFVQYLDYVSDLDIRRVFKDDTLLRGENERFQTSNRGERVFVRFFQGLERHSWAHQTSSAGKWATPHDLLIIKYLM